MGATPQAPRAPVPPPPPRSGSHVVAIVLLILALIIVVCGITLYTGARFLSHNVQVQVQKDQGGQKDVSITTPVGKLEVHKDPTDVTEARLGLPIYPGARAVKDDQSASVSLEFAGEKRMQVAAAKFETPDDLEKVEAFYKDRIGSEITKFIQKDEHGKTVFEIKRLDDERVVALTTLMTGTRIELVHVVHGEKQVN